VTLFEYLVFSHVPAAIKLVGMGVAIVGIVLLSLGGARKSASHPAQGETYD
jgi:multidrug transporter EmrE-like cation transporter